ncbi:DUF6088 family protein [Pandoraea sp. NPDC087047]|uniref:DUF6088 family protein n=1 Tax=Pandoraea sp. NPDC087047 TaxID=3364390 RepID=UPI0037FF69C5
MLRQQTTDVFPASDFATLGSRTQRGRALRELVTDGMLVKLGMSVYARAKPSILSGKPIPVRPLEVLAPQALKRLGVMTLPSKSVAAYNAGRTGQLPANVIVNTGNRRITRKLEFGNRRVQYENHRKRAS